MKFNLGGRSFWNRRTAEDAFWIAVLLILIAIQAYVCTKVQDWAGTDVLDRID